MKRLFSFILLFILILTFKLYSNVRITGTMNRNLRILYIYNLRDIANFQYPLFTLTVNNDADTTAYCHLMITLSSKRFGEITYLSTNQFPMNPHEIWSFQNNTITNNPKQIVLSNFEINPNLEGLINETLSRGKLPEDIYYIRIEVLDSYNNVLSMWSDQFTIINSITITSIFPGTIYMNQPFLINTSSIKFIWNSHISMAYNFYLYEYSPSIVSGLNIGTNPIFKAENLSSRSLNYPQTAPPLKLGQMYIWQVTGYIITSSGGRIVKSDPLYFVYGGISNITDEMIIKRLKHLLDIGDISNKSKIVDIKLNDKRISRQELKQIIDNLDKSKIVQAGVTK